MNYIYQFLNKKLPKKAIYQYLVFFLLISVVSLVLHLLLDVLNLGSVKEIAEQENHENKLFLFLGMVVLAPFFETFLFQWMPVFIYTSLCSNRKYDFLVLIIGGVVFGAFHTYNLGYSIAATAVGGLYMLMALFYSRRDDNFFVPIVLVHLLNNLLAFAKYL